MIVDGAHVPNELPILTRPVLESLDSSKFDGLKEQRETARRLIDCVQAMHKAYVSLGYRQFDSSDSFYQAFREIYDDPAHPLSGLSDAEKDKLIISADDARWALPRTDHTTLSPQHWEDRAYMTRLFNEHAQPIGMRSLCAYPEEMREILDLYRDNPDKRLAIVVNFPNGVERPKEAKANIKNAVTSLREAGIENPIDVDSVRPYHAHMRGEHKLVDDVLAAEAEAVRQTGVTWKPILKLSVDAYADKNTTYGKDFFTSAYDSTWQMLAHGADAAKNGTGQAAARPFNHFVPADIAYPHLVIPMMLATRDFNAEYGTNRTNKISGGSRNVGDAAGYRYLAQEFGFADTLMLGAGYRFRPELLRFIHELEGDDCGFDETVFDPYSVDPDSIPPTAYGLQLPAAKAG